MGARNRHLSDGVKYSSCKTSAHFYKNYMRGGKKKNFPLTPNPPAKKVPRKLGEVFRIPGILNGRGYVLKQADWWKHICSFLHCHSPVTCSCKLACIYLYKLHFIYGQITCER